LLQTRLSAVTQAELRKNMLRHISRHAGARREVMRSNLPEHFCQSKGTAHEIRPLLRDTRASILPPLGHDRD